MKKWVWLQSGVSFICAYILFFSGIICKINGSGVVVACVVTLLSTAVLVAPAGVRLIPKYKTKGRFAAILLVATYASLASFGYDILSMNEARMKIDFLRVIYLLIGTVWYVPIVFSILFALEYISKKLSSRPLPVGNRQKAYVVLLSILCAIQLVLAGAFWPGGFPNDTVWILSQAAGDNWLTDWHPVFYTLTFRLVLSVFHDVGSAVLIQMLLFAWLVTEFLMIGYDKGVSLHTLILIGMVFLLLPNQALSGIGAVKDYPFMLALLWGTMLLVKLSMDSSCYRKVGFLIQLFCAQFFILAYRHNGILPAIFIAGACSIVAARSMKKKRFILVMPSALAFLMFVVFKGPIFKTLQVYENTSSPYVTMICAVGSVVNKNLPLSEDANRILEEVMPLEDWGKYYSRFEGHDQYMWGRGDKVFDTSSITASKAFRIYLEALMKYPDVVFKDRLDGMNILWCVEQPDDSFNIRYFDSVYRFDYTSDYIDVSELESAASDWDGYVKHSAIADFYRKHDASAPNSIGNVLLWRSGIYIISMAIMTIFWAANHMKHMVLPSIPLLGNTFASVLLIYHQSFRYVYYFQVLTLALAFVSILTKEQDLKH